MPIGVVADGRGGAEQRLFQFCQCRFHILGFSAGADNNAAGDIGPRGPNSNFEMNAAAGCVSNTWINFGPSAPSSFPCGVGGVPFFIAALIALLTL